MNCQQVKNISRQLALKMNLTSMRRFRLDYIDLRQALENKRRPPVATIPSKASVRSRALLEKFRCIIL
jgi:hypothetical protein